jgi:hypothetical protein
MTLTTTTEVKKWLRGLALLKRDVEMRSAFYIDLIRDSQKMKDAGKRHEKYYLARAERLHQKMQQATADTDRLMELLEPEERVILHARYIKGVLWDGIEFYVHYSRRNAVRIHNRALKKLVGQEVETDVYAGEA